MIRFLPKIVFFLISFLLLCSLGQAMAQDPATPNDAVRIVKKTITAIKTDGPQKVYAEIIAKDAKFIDRDIYPIVYTMNGICLAHGANPRLAGMDLSGTEDIDGKRYGKERGEKAKTMKEFWIYYKYKNPITNKISPKEVYCETLGKTIICAGIYKD